MYVLIFLADPFTFSLTAHPTLTQQAHAADPSCILLLTQLLYLTADPVCEALPPFPLIKLYNSACIIPLIQLLDLTADPVCQILPPFHLIQLYNSA